MQHHPLEDPSLAPFGFVSPHSRKRLRWKHPGHLINPDLLPARFWESLHRASAPRPYPIETIVHEILPSMATANRFTNGDFDFGGLPYLSRDVLVLSTIVQWFGTSCGRDFLVHPSGDYQDNVFVLAPYHSEREFVWKLEYERRRREDVLAILLFGPEHDPGSVTRRDRALAEGLMRWLGKQAGRAFITELERRRQQAARDAMRKRMQHGQRLHVA